MILECPECSSRFRVPDNALKDSGRRVRCGACSHIWLAQAHADRDEFDSVHPAGPGPAGGDETGPEPESQSHILSSIAATVEQGIEAEDAPDENVVDDEPGISDPFAKSDTPPDQGREALGRELGETMERLRVEEPVYGSAAVPAISPRPSRLILLGWALWALFVTGGVSAFFLMQDTLIKVWPPVGQAYEMLGMTQVPDPAPVVGEQADLMPDEALSVQIDSNPEWLADDRGWTLQVGGIVGNETNRDYTLPALHLLLLGADEQILKSKAVVLDRSSLMSREKLRFSVRIDDAPAETTGIVHEWQKRSEN